jgi:hypothetical protein
MNHNWAWSFLFVFAVSSGAHAQTASAQASGDIELGATEPSRVELRGGADDDDGPRANRGRGPVHDDGDIRLGLQLRLDAINTLALSSSLEFAALDLNNIGQQLFVPLATPGVRILDDELFLGLGFGFVGASVETGPAEFSRSGFSISPLASYDLLDDDTAALSVLGWFNLASLGETEECVANVCEDQNDDEFAVGLSLGAGLRGFLSESVAIGGELGWGFLSASADSGGDVFVHGLFANVLLEASMML